ncbi:serine hydrolase domain-containing protein [Pelagibacterium mangrovi]|uniref:serine hydrolase domain-containing protein n=1 Tax=Pelagibacterium mangrovi TaxID=3119828 RepID=UPI002FC6E656
MTTNSYLCLPSAMALVAILAMVVPAISQEADDTLSTVLDAADELESLRTIVVAHVGEILADRGYDDYSTSTPTNIKSASKVIVTTMIGIAIEQGLLESADQPIATLLADDLPDDPPPQLDEVTLSHLMSMQAGLRATSGANYGAWVTSPNWVRAALAQPFTDAPGGDMIYSTGSTHLLSAILTEVGGQSTLALAREWFAPIEGFSISAWERDPQGIYLGGNEMAMSPLSLLAFGEMIRNGGVTAEGERIVPQAWIEQSWEQRTTSRFGGHGYGYGWFLANIGGFDTRYAWGYGGQMLYIVPDLDLTVVMTSDPTNPSGGNGYRDRLHDLLADIIAAVETETP